MRIFRIIGKFIELSRWFNRKSQHYVLGNWLEYTNNYDYKNGCFDWKIIKYMIRCPKAWIKFMCYSCRDILSTQ